MVEKGGPVILQCRGYLDLCLIAMPLRTLVTGEGCHRHKVYQLTSWGDGVQDHAFRSPPVHVLDVSNR